jgi:hypothetical protein
VAERYGPALVTPEMMPSENVNEDVLPNGMDAGTEFLQQLQGEREGSADE